MDAKRRSDCRVAELTPSGRGAVATVAVWGAAASRLLANFFRPASGKPYADIAAGSLAFGSWVHPDGAEDVVVRTGTDDAEIHCHGGRAAAEAIIATLMSAGAAAASGGAWLREAHPSDALSLAAHDALSEALTERTAAILLDQHRGALRTALLDVSDSLRQRRCVDAQNGLQRLLTLADLGLHLTHPWRVVLAGPANVGKSSLVNCLLGFQRSIVFDRPGTTRDVVRTTMAVDGWPIELSDTAGLRIGEDALESAGVDEARRSIADADLVVAVHDARQDAKPLLLDAVGSVINVSNKCDLLAETGAETRTLVSAVTGFGVQQLLADISRRLVPNPPRPGTAVPFLAKQVSQLKQAEVDLKNGEFTACGSRLLSLLADETEGC